MAGFGRKRLFTDQQLIELHKLGFNDKEIADKLGAYRKTVGDHRRILGLKAHDRRYRRLFTDQQLIELHEQGFNDREIGEKLGADRRTVNIHRRRLGLRPIRKHGIKAHDPARS